MQQASEQDDLSSGDTCSHEAVKLTGYIGSRIFSTRSGGICSASDRDFAPGPRCGGVGSWMCRAMWLILKSKEYTSHPSNLGSHQYS